MSAWILYKCRLCALIIREACSDSDLEEMRLGQLKPLPTLWHYSHPNPTEKSEALADFVGYAEATE